MYSLTSRLFKDSYLGNKQSCHDQFIVKVNAWDLEALPKAPAAIRFRASSSLFFLLDKPAALHRSLRSSCTWHRKSAATWWCYTTAFQLQFVKTAMMDVIVTQQQLPHFNTFAAVNWALRSSCTNHSIQLLLVVWQLQCQHNERALAPFLLSMHLHWATNLAYMPCAMAIEQ